MNEDCISREELLKELSVVQNRPVSTAMKIIRCMPSVQPEQKVGHWIEIEDDDETWGKCSNCGFMLKSDGNRGYDICCRMCGSKNL